MVSYLNINDRRKKFYFNYKKGKAGIKKLNRHRNSIFYTFKISKLENILLLESVEGGSKRDAIHYLM